MKTIVRSNFRVVVEPRRLGDYGYVRTSDSAFGRSAQQIAQDYQDRCDAIAQDIKRHVDNVGSVDVQFDTEEKCSHCGYTWSPSEDDSDPAYPKGTPLCCEKAIAEHKAMEASK